MEQHIIKFDNNIRMEAVALPELKSDEVLIKIKYSVISNGTEKACLLEEENTKNVPERFGYSGVGHIVKIGSGVKNIKEGDRVFAAYIGHADYGIRRATSVWKIPDSVSFEDAIFTKLASFPLLALRRSRFEPGESVAIVGTGMLGILGVQLAQIFGAIPVISLGGSREERIKKAKEFGADYALSNNDPELVKRIINITKKHTMFSGVNVVIDTSGAEDALHKALKYTANNGRIVLNGCNRTSKKPINLYQDVHLKGISIIGANNGNRPQNNSSPYNWTTQRDYKALLQWMAMGKLRPSGLISEYASPNDYKTVFDRLLNDREFPLGVLFDWDNFTP
ncbi:MAG: zinc-binding alcohol dehydrogenase [Ruminiclostridium sp.]|nr:zinc-binding alcohol dehydrogenase [Ruminiclostridium sp.]